MSFVIKMREAWKATVEFFVGICGERDPNNPRNGTVRRKPGVGGWLCIGFRLVGAVLIVASPLVLGLPFLIGATWIDTVILFALTVEVGRRFLDFYRYWFAATGFLRAAFHILVHGRKGLDEVLA